MQAQPLNFSKAPQIDWLSAEWHTSPHCFIELLAAHEHRPACADRCHRTDLSDSSGFSLKPSTTPTGDYTTDTL